MIINYNEGTDEGCFLEVDCQYLEKLHELHNNLAFLPEKIKIEKFEKLIANLHDKTEYGIQTRKFKKGIKSWISVKKSSYSDKL